jgi:hypothetical protein
LEKDEDLDRERIEALLGPRRQTVLRGPEERAALR